MTETHVKVSSDLEDSFAEMRPRTGTEIQRKMSSVLENSITEMTETTRKVSSALEGSFDEMSVTQRKMSSALEEGYDGLVSSLQNLPSTASVKVPRKARSQVNLRYIRNRFHSLRPTSYEMDEDNMMFHPDKPWLKALLGSQANGKHKTEHRPSITSQKWRSYNSSKNELSFNPEQIKVGYDFITVLREA